MKKIKLKSNNKAFTMAEILISLTIIGAVAMIILPSLIGNINERFWNTQRKALYSRLSQAIAMMPYLSGYGTYVASAENVAPQDTAAETFVTNGLSKHLKITSVCNSEHLSDCGIPTSFTNMLGNKVNSFPKKMSEFNKTFVDHTVDRDWGEHYYYTQANTITAAFQTINGDSLAVFYNPNCSSKSDNQHHYAQPEMCANFIYDLNGTKGPNEVGKDIGFITALYQVNSVVVAPLPIKTTTDDLTLENALKACASIKDSKLPTREELQSIFYNKLFIGERSWEWDYWSSTKISPTSAWMLHWPVGTIRNWGQGNKATAKCIMQ